MKTLIFLSFLAFLGAVAGTRVNGGKQIFCARARITAVRIQNCMAEPCTIKKGQKLPVEIDFSFQTPTEAKQINFQVFSYNWGGTAFGSNLAQGSDCKQLGLRSCPARAGVKHTLKSSISLPANAVGRNKEKTGTETTQWTLNPTRRENNPNAYSTCNFDVKFKIVQ